MDRPLGVRLLRPIRVGGERAASGRACRLPFHRRQVRRATPQPHDGDLAARQAAADRPGERRRRPDRVGPGPVLRREVARRRVDRHDTEAERDRPAGGANQLDAQPAPRCQVQRLRRGELHFGLVRPARIGWPASQQLPVPERIGNPAVRRRVDVQHRRAEHAVRRHRGRLADLGNALASRGHQRVGSRAPGDQRRIRGVGAARPGRHRDDHAAGQARQDREHQPGPPPRPQPGPHDQPDSCHVSHLAPDS